MPQIPNPDSWPDSTAKTITVHPPKDGYKRPVGFATWAADEKPRSQEPDGRDGNVRPSAEAGDGEGLLIRRPPQRLRRRDQPSAGPGGSQ